MQSKKVTLKFKSRFPKIWSKLTKVKGNVWCYTTNSRFMRFIDQDKDNYINAVDPEGGPYINIGSILYKKYKVLKIYRDTDNKVKFEMERIKKNEQTD